MEGPAQACCLMRTSHDRCSAPSRQAVGCPVKRMAVARAQRVVEIDLEPAESSRTIGTWPTPTSLCSERSLRATIADNRSRSTQESWTMPEESDRTCSDESC
jgi:hypothetical protein